MKTKEKEQLKMQILDYMIVSKIHISFNCNSIQDFKDKYFANIFWNDWLDLIAELKYEGFLDAKGCVTAKGVIFDRKNGYTITYKIKKFLSENIFV